MKRKKLSKEKNYYRIKEYDFNDVFDYSKIVYGTHEQVKRYLIEQYKPEHRKRLNIDESSEDIHILDYMDTAEDEELRLDTSFSAELIYNDNFPHQFIDLTPTK